MISNVGSGLGQDTANTKRGEETDYLGISLRE
jgi:hypothetical protein